MKIQVEAVMKGTRVSPSTGQAVHFNPDAKRNKLLRRPLIDERDVDFFVDEGFIDPPPKDAKRIGLEEAREIIAQANDAVRGARRRRNRAGRRSRLAQTVAADKVEEALEAEDQSGPFNTGLDSRQTRNHDPRSNVGQKLLGAGDGGEAEGGGDEGSGGDPEAPPSGGKPAAKTRTVTRRSGRRTGGRSSGGSKPAES